MTRRILLALLAFTAAVLVGAVVPLTLNATEHDRSSFVQAAAGMVRVDATVAQYVLDGSEDFVPIPAQSLQAGDGLLIMTSKAIVTGGGHIIYQQGRRSWDESMPAGNWNWNQVASEADQQAQLAKRDGQPIQPFTETTGSQIIAAMPVYNRGVYQLVGTVILARSTRPLDHEITELWIILGSIAAAAMIGAALMAFGLARWLSRPLKSLDAAARRLADGDLEIRAEVGSGPPELRRLATTFNTMAGRLEALVHGSRAVIADVSHQLRTPLAALRLRLDLLHADTAHSEPATAHELAGALDELARLSRLVDGLLAVARAENVVAVPVAVDVAEVASERVVAWHPVADDRSITLAVTPVGTPVLAWIGDGHLEQILDNLIANALEALSPGGRVILSTAATPAGTRITVTDNGPGMSAEDRERAFLRFGTSSPNGTGLGLAIVHRLTTSNGGTASLAETPGGGLTVTLDFPPVPPDGGGAAGNAASGQAVFQPVGKH